MWYVWTSDHFNAHSFRWIKAFKAGKFSVEDDTRPGRHKTAVTKANIAAVKIVVEQKDKRQKSLIYRIDSV